MDMEKIVKVGGLVTTVLGAGLTLASSFLDDKKMDLKIAKEVSKHLGKR